MEENKELPQSGSSHRSIQMKRFTMALVLVLMAAAVFAQTKPKLGILPFTGGTEQDGDTIANLFSNSPDLAQTFELVARTDSTVRTIAEEQRSQAKDSDSGISNPDTIASAGNLMEAEYIVSGHTASFMNRRLLLIAIINIKTMQLTVGDYREYGEGDSIRGFLPDMAKNIVSLFQKAADVPEKTLSVLPLEIQDANAQQKDAEILAQILATDIANSREYAVLLRTETSRKATEKERETQGSAWVNPDTRVEGGNATNPDHVLQGQITRLQGRNLFMGKIIAVPSGRLVNGKDTEYTNLEDGIDLASKLAFELTGVATGRYKAVQDDAAARASRDAADAANAAAAAKKIEAETKVRNAIHWVFAGYGRYTSFGVNAGLGLGNGNGLGINGFGNISLTLPLVWTLFAEGGIDVGFAGSIGSDADGDKEITVGSKAYFAYRPYARLNIGLPLGGKNSSTLFLLYMGGGFGYTNAWYEFDYEETLLDKTVTRTREYTGLDLAFGLIITGTHHGFRLKFNLNNLFDVNFDSHENLEAQFSFGYAYRF
jgi:hypothetical protein